MEPLEIIIKEPSDLKLSYVSGAYAAAFNDGMIHLNCYNERRSTPETLTLSLSEEGSVESTKFNHKGPDITREIIARLVMDKETAGGLSKLLAQYAGQPSEE